MKFLKTLTFIVSIYIAATSFAADTPSSGAPNSDQALQRLIEGNQRFVSGSVAHPSQGSARRSEVSTGQKPFAAILSCSDSRVPPELIFDQGLGDLFIVRVAGNTVNEEGLGSLEFGVKVLGAPLLLVLGHSDCGAVDAALQGKPLPGHISSVATPIDPAIKEASCKTNSQPLPCAIHANVDHIVQTLSKSEPILAALVKEGKLKVVGATYDLATGKVEFQSGGKIVEKK